MGSSLRASRTVTRVSLTRVSSKVRGLTSHTRTPFASERQVRAIGVTDGARTLPDGSGRGWRRPRNGRAHDPVRSRATAPRVDVPVGVLAVAVVEHPAARDVLDA